jgi:hypothetical protein
VAAAAAAAAAASLADLRALAARFPTRINEPDIYGRTILDNTVMLSDEEREEGEVLAVVVAGR